MSSLAMLLRAIAQDAQGPRIFGAPQVTVQQRNMPKGRPKTLKRGKEWREMADLSLMTEEELAAKVAAERPARIGRLKKMIKWHVPDFAEEPLPPWFVEACEELMKPKLPLEELSPSDPRWFKLQRRESIKASNRLKLKSKDEDRDDEKKVVAPTAVKKVNDDDDNMGLGHLLLREPAAWSDGE